MPLHLFLDTDFTDREKEKTPRKKKCHSQSRVSPTHCYCSAVLQQKSCGCTPVWVDVLFNCEPKQLKWMGGWGWWWLVKSVWREDGTKTGSYLISLCRGMGMKALATASAANTASCISSLRDKPVHVPVCACVFLCACAFHFLGLHVCVCVFLFVRARINALLVAVRASTSCACLSVCMCVVPVSELWSSLVVSLC